MRSAIVGAGPAGFYAAQALLKRFPQTAIDIIERLPVPFGLVRYGVAPDHPATKNVINGFSNFVQTNRHQINFYGNLTVADHHPVTPEILNDFYDLIIYATGASSPRKLPGIQIPSSFVYGAQDFAFWVNGHPDVFKPSPTPNLKQRLEHDLSTTRDVAVIGVGNVAIDIARILLRPPADFQNTDISPSALELLRSDPIKSVTLFGRKSPAGAAWTTAALREIVTKIPAIVTACDHSVIRRDLQLTNLPRSKLSALKLLAERTVDINSADLHHHELSNSKILRLEFLKSPTAFCAKENCVEMQMKLNHHESDDRTALVHTFGAIFLSLGYCGGGGPGHRVGWANGKASGIIGDNKWDAETVVSTLPEISSGKKRAHDFIQSIASVKQTAVTWEGWERIDAVEKNRGRVFERQGNRVKLETIQDILQVAEGAISV